jgi:hypothetical protein
MRTAPGSPSSGAAACVFKNAHSASCSSVAPPPHASSARPAAPCALASTLPGKPKLSQSIHLELSVVDVKSRGNAAWAQLAGAHLQRVLDDVDVGEGAAVAEVRRLAGGGACAARGACGKRTVARGVSAPQRRQQRGCPRARRRRHGSAPAETVQAASCAASAGVTASEGGIALSMSGLGAVGAR